METVHWVRVNGLASACGLTLGVDLRRSSQWTQDTREATCRACLGTIPPGRPKALEKTSHRTERLEEWLDS